MRGLAALLLAASLVGCSGPAADPAADPVADPAADPTVESAAVPTDAEALASALARRGLDAVAMDPGSLILKRDGLQVLVFVEDAGASLQAVFPHTGRLAPLDPDAIATWNATRRFGRAYRDEDGLPVLASDLLLVGGVDLATVADWSRLVLDMAAVFAHEVWPVPVPLPEAPGA